MAKKKGRLAQVKAGRLDEPVRIFLHAEEGLGKTTFAANSDRPILFDIEGGSGNLDVPRYPFVLDDTGRLVEGGHVPRGYQDVLNGIETLRTEEHEYKTLVLDTVDALEGILWDYVCEKGSRRDNRITSIEGFGYGKGFQFALDEWRLLTQKLDKLRKERTMTILLLGHTTVETYRNPRGDDYDRFRVRLHKKAAGHLKDWCDILAFAAMEETTEKEKGSSKAKGFMTGMRLVHLERDAAYEAKSRIPMPAELVMPAEDPFGPFAKALEEGRQTKASDLVELIEVELARIGDESLAEKVRAECGKVSDNEARLSRYLNKLRRYEAVAA